MNKNIFRALESLLSGSKKEFINLNLPGICIEFGFEYSIKNNRAVVVIYDFNNKSGKKKLSPISCLGLVMTYIFKNYLQEMVSKDKNIPSVIPDDIKFFYKLIRDDNEDHEFAVLNPFITCFNKSFVNFKEPDIQFINNCFSDILKDIQSDFFSKSNIIQNEEVLV